MPYSNDTSLKKSTAAAGAAALGTRRGMGSDEVRWYEMGWDRIRAYSRRDGANRCVRRKQCTYTACDTRRAWRKIRHALAQHRGGSCCGCYWPTPTVLPTNQPIKTRASIGRRKGTYRNPRRHTPPGPTFRARLYTSVRIGLSPPSGTFSDSCQHEVFPTPPFCGTEPLLADK